MALSANVDIVHAKQLYAVCSLMKRTIIDCLATCKTLRKLRATGDF